MFVRDKTEGSKLILLDKCKASAHLTTELITKQNANK